MLAGERDTFWKSFVDRSLERLGVQLVSSKRIVVALGGNAITQPHEEGNVEEQFANSRITAKSLADLIEQGHKLTVTHGNGPQIGNFLLRNEAAAGKIYPLPMEVAVAHVQGGMGFMIAEALTNELSFRRLDKRASALITMIEVDRNDPSFSNPTKPIGRILTKEDADKFAGQEGWRIKEITEGKYRRVVPSPKPISTPPSGGECMSSHGNSSGRSCHGINGMKPMAHSWCTASWMIEFRKMNPCISSIEIPSAATSEIASAIVSQSWFVDMPKNDTR